MQAFLNVVSGMGLTQDAIRLFHGRGGAYPQCEHLCLDWFSPVLLLTSFKTLTDEDLNIAVSAIKDRWQTLSNEPLNLVFQYRSGLGTKTEVIEGEVPEKHMVTEHGAQYLIHLLKGQNHGLFLDMSNGRNWVKQNAQGKKVLNLFAYTCGFSVVALLGHAEKVVNIDMSKGALSIGKQNHHLNGLEGNASFLGHDIFKSWGKLKKNGPYDMIIADPPSNQKGSFIATKDYSRLLKRLPELMTNNCELLLCLNAPELDESYLKEQVNEMVPQLEFIARLDNPDAFIDVDSDRALKVLHYKNSERLSV
ncbi:class I SAM-dependent methyltransferase [Shewanella sp. 202IG2-18]|uniref:class I SAM-dependent methyltransferase n=1 Tax=Parashewanella hymeniacidonis TaxID=2807618 RepID=UPI0019606072|nr:class I SAM-dependent methyltransferase [Parashewanella hymeniacidonis]MBM7070773.1 class I SAM-dependent methyltransferase [Parashewanella hymeniacidonis]